LTYRGFTGLLAVVRVGPERVQWTHLGLEISVTNASLREFPFSSNSGEDEPVKLGDGYLTDKIGTKCPIIHLDITARMASEGSPTVNPSKIPFYY